MFKNCIPAAAIAGVCILYTFTASAEVLRYGQRKCEKCQVGEYLEIVHDLVPAGEYVYREDPPCGPIDDTTTKIGKSLLKAADTAVSKNKKNLVGSAAGVAHALGVGGTVGKILADYSGNPGNASCKAVCGALPSGAEVDAIRISISQGYDGKENQMENVDPGQKGAGWAHVFYPSEKDGALCVVVATWVANKSRRVDMRYWFKSPHGVIEVR